MTAERIKGQLTFECDGPGCHAFQEPESRDFKEALAEIKADGWTIHSLDERTWFHKCPLCSTSAPPDMKKLLP